ncbi:MAG: segregation and condensation protein A [Planctomycetota bacterium]|jgi:segregation and condensation protein A
MPLQEDYQVRLDAFCGPLDLLLYLIRQAEVDIHDIPMAEITDQYLAFLKQVEDIDIEAAGEFLVVAATLMEVKSRTLMPPEEGDEPAPADGAEGTGRGVADPRVELVQQLLEYQKYRVASETLHQRRAEFDRRYPARSHAVDDDGAAEPPGLELEDAHVYDLFGTYRRIIASIDFDRMGDHHVEIDDTPAAVYQEDLLDRLRRAPGTRLTLQEAFEGQTRVQRIGLFLAMLELVRLRMISVRQEDLLAEIVVELDEEGTEGLRD